MISSLLLYLIDTASASTAIEFGVPAAARSEARVRGVTLLDTRRFASMATTCESAASFNAELSRLNAADLNQGTVSSKLSSACLRAKVNFDVRRLKGDPFDVLPRESRFHDLTVTTLPAPGEPVIGDHRLTAGEILALLSHGVQPLLVLRVPARPIQRVLIVSDGMPASNGVVRQFLSQNLFPGADHRLLAIGEQANHAQDLLRELVDCGHQRRIHFESGWLRGPTRKYLIPYAQKWQADLVVTGVTRQIPLLRPFCPQLADQILSKTSMALYAAT